MRRLLPAIIGLLFAALLAVLLALRSPELTLSLAEWAVNTFAGLRLDLRNPHIDVYGGTLTADEIHLYPPDASAPALVSLLNVSASWSFGGPSTGSLLSSTLEADSLSIYVSDQGGGAPPAPTQWLAYLQWLPARLRLEWVHLITASANTWIFPLKSVRGDRLAEGDYRARATADYAGEPLLIELEIGALQRGRDTASARGTVAFTAPDSGSHINLDGTLEGTTADFHYDVTLNGFYRDIREFLRGFEGGQDLAGALLLQGRLRGDAAGLRLSDARFILDNLPQYGFEAAGELAYSYAGQSSIALTATGELASLDYLVQWLEVDAAGLGSARSELKLGGSLDRPEIEHFRLSTGNEAGLLVSVEGQLKLYDSTEDDAAPNTILIEVEGPDLAALHKWVGEVSYDPGPWRASGRLTGNQRAVSLTDLTVLAGTAETLQLRATGSVRQIQLPATEGQTYSADGIDLKLAARAADSAELPLALRGRIGDLATLSQVSLEGRIDGWNTRELLLIPLPDFSYAGELGSLSGNFSLKGNNGKWTLSGLSLTNGDPDTTLQASLGGEIRDLTGLPQADLDVDASFRDSQLLQALTTLPLSPLELALEIRSSEAGVRGTLSADLGRTQLEAYSVIAFDGEAVHSVQFALETPHLYLQDLFSVQQSLLAPAAGGEPVEPLSPLARARQSPPGFPIDVAVTIGGISGDNSNIDSLALRITGVDNRYTLEQFTADYGSGLAEVRGIVDLSAEPAALSLAASASALQLSDILTDVGVKSDIRGTLTVNGGVTLIGDTPATLLENLNGSVAMALEDAIIEGAAYDLLATDLLAWIYSGALNDKSTYIDCTMAKFDLRQGVASSDDLFIESARMVATGRARFDLVRQEMDLRITPLSKSRTLQVPSEVRLKGPMSNPQAKVSAITAVADATSAAIMLIPELTMKLFGFNRPSEQAYRPCQAETPK